MKHLIFIISLTTLVVWNLACTKESLDQPKNNDCIEKTIVLEEGGRFGSFPIWFQTSNSTDNALTGEVREHLIFNQAKINFQKFTPTGEEPFSYLGVYHWPYIMETHFQNDSIGIKKVSVGYVNGQAFTHYPNVVNNLLKDSHQAYVVKFVSDRSKQSINAFRDQQFSLKSYMVYYDDELQFVEHYTPMTKLYNTPNFGHKY